VSTTYRVTHRTEYHYQDDVAPSYSQLHLLPRDTPGQRCRSSEIHVDPTPDDYRERTDFFGNRVAYVAVERPHRVLTVTAVSLVEVDDDDGELPLYGNQPWEVVRDHLRDDVGAEVIDAYQFALDSPLVTTSPVFAAYALPSFTPGRQIVDAVADLVHRIHGDFRYQPGATAVTTRLEDVFELREGVCQDFAHVGIACLRSLGLAARYVSGYLETDPPPGQPKLQGADTSHAWLSVFVPDAGWVGVDPTNDQPVNDRYVVTAWGRDYGDVPPLHGVIYTEGPTVSLEVAVDVTALPGSDSSLQQQQQQQQ